MGTKWVISRPGLTASELITKQPFEKRKYTMDFSNLITDTGDVVATGSGMIINSTFMNGDATDLLVTTSGTGANTKSVTFHIESGTKARRYRIETQIHTTSGYKLEGDGILFVGDQ